MVIVAIVVVVVLTFVIAAWAIGREAQRLGSQRLMPVYRLEEAVGDVAERLPYDVAAATDTDTLRVVLREHINLVQFSDGAASDDDAEPMMLEGETTAAAVYRRVRAEGHDVTRPHVDAMLEGHLGYLSAIGALQAVDDD